ncbi:Hypothetical predicted protein [Lecanosticta acicola]|uniref:Uncharacterized protein n=1 Tax=Lecanosticta acicola TaxID=111012 RepID=A0AAI8YS34_9PEZI|nr:Hypothetical predicted protein [Lecanosticta acicola]
MDGQGQQSESGPRSPATLPELDFSHHPFNVDLHLDFPTLNGDGSLDDLTAHQSRRQSRTPPAALSSLGARIKMDTKNKDTLSESSSSLTDSQYDMLDDLSEISTDDHETASLPSNNDDAQLTLVDGFEDGSEDGSEDEVEESESALLLDSLELATPPRLSTARPTFQHVLANQKEHEKAGEDLFSSYGSDDLETPRQSTMPEASSPAKRRSTIVPTGPFPTQSSPSAQTDKTANHILFVSDRTILQREMDLICIRVASCMDTSTINTPHRVVRFPKTPSGITLASPTTVYAQDKLSATVQQCIEADTRMGSSPSWQLRILDSDEVHSSIYTIGKNAKIDLPTPDIAVIYLDDEASQEQWFSAAYRALRSLKVPVLVVHQPTVDHPLTKQKDAAKVVMTIDDFVVMDRSALTTLVSDLQSGRIPRLLTKEKRLTWAGVRVDGHLISWSYTIVLLCILLSLTLNLYPAIAARWNTSDPAPELAYRREGLRTALSKATDSSIVVQDLDIDHLLPVLDRGCLSENVSKPACEQHIATSQAFSPNHLVVSMSAYKRFPTVTAAHVYKSDGRQLSFNQTKLIEGVYGFTFDAREAYGTVVVNIMAIKPERNITASHDFGRRILQRRTYEKAGTDVSKAVGKDVAIIRDAAKGLTDKLSTEVGAGVWATRNVTTQLALQMAKDLQAIGNTAVSVFNKAAKAGNRTATTLSKDFVLMQKDLVQFTKDLSTIVKSKVESAKSSSKDLIRKPLVQSRERLMEIRKALQEREAGKKVDNIVKTTSRQSDSSATSASDAYVHAVKNHKKLQQQVNRLSSRIKKQPGQDSTRVGLKQLKKQLREHEKTIKDYEEKVREEYAEVVKDPKKNNEKTQIDEKRASWF